MTVIRTYFLAALMLLAGGALWAQTGPLVETQQLNFRVDTFLTDLEVPWAMAFLPNGDMLFTERGGDLHIVRDGKLHPTPIAGVPPVLARGQGGLLDIELHPDYAENGWIYLSFASPAKEGEEGDGANTEFIRVRLEGNRLVDHEHIFKASPNYKTRHHYGGRMEFDGEGYLYLTVGDRGGRDEVQDLSNHRGKVMRLHDDGRVPEDNPFLDVEGAQPEIFSYGHRNPQGMDIHPETGEVWAHEHGPKGGDELNIVRAGNNYGWPEISYGINYDGTIFTEDTAREGMEQPITYWVPSIAPCGMSFVNSRKYGEWEGDILVGSLAFRYLVRVELDGNTVTKKEVMLENLGRVRAIEEGPDGYIYVAVEGPGMIVRLIPEEE
ncbi:MAG: PQQ-dependent sugar dehydrogenase [Bacteroidetes bacterium]|nr:MAG: PQQ-dependent sugar dehydrogenase [Bacteroidota bacterium]